MKKGGESPEICLLWTAHLVFVSFSNHILTHADCNMCTTVCSGVLVFQKQLSPTLYSAKTRPSFLSV